MRLAALALLALTTACHSYAVGVTLTVRPQQVQRHSRGAPRRVERVERREP